MNEPDASADVPAELTEEHTLLLEEATKDFSDASSEQDLEAARVKHLGRKAGLVQAEFDKIRTLPGDRRRAFGRSANALKKHITALCSDATARLHSGRSKRRDLDYTNFVAAIAKSLDSMRGPLLGTERAFQQLAQGIQRSARALQAPMVALRESILKATPHIRRQMLGMTSVLSESLDKVRELSPLGMVERMQLLREPLERYPPVFDIEDFLQAGTVPSAVQRHSGHHSPELLRGRQSPDQQSTPAGHGETSSTEARPVPMQRAKELVEELALVVEEMSHQVGGQDRDELHTLASDYLNSFEEYLLLRLVEGAEEPSGAPRFDMTLPGRAPQLGHIHVLSQTLDMLADAAASLGFSVVEGPEAELEYFNFDALNIPLEHPAYDPFDTFYLETPDGAPKMVLRSHTSPVQVREMRKATGWNSDADELKDGPPLRVVAPGRVYRPDKVDATHYHTFHQLEGLAVDRDITFADLRYTLELFARGVFGEDVRARFRPSYFPFTEPSAEMDISCPFCAGALRRAHDARVLSESKGAGARKCAVCKGTGWLEILGCGMVHPNVLRVGGYDPERVTGFAFGMGIERPAMLRHGIRDIRLFIDPERGNDLRFLEQF